jgi:hypothetical protein
MQTCGDSVSDQSAKAAALAVGKRSPPRVIAHIGETLDARGNQSSRVEKIIHLLLKAEPVLLLRVAEEKRNGQARVPARLTFGFACLLLW